MMRPLRQNKKPSYFSTLGHGLGQQMLFYIYIYFCGSGTGAFAVRSGSAPPSRSTPSSSRARSRSRTPGLLTQRGGQLHARHAQGHDDDRQRGPQRHRTEEEQATDEKMVRAFSEPSLVTGYAGRGRAALRASVNANIFLDMEMDRKANRSSTSCGAPSIGQRGSPRPAPAGPGTGVVHDLRQRQTTLNRRTDSSGAEDGSSSCSPVTGRPRRTRYVYDQGTRVPPRRRLRVQQQRGPQRPVRDDETSARSAIEAADEIAAGRAPSRRRRNEKRGRGSLSAAAPPTLYTDSLEFQQGASSSSSRHHMYLPANLVQHDGPALVLGEGVRRPPFHLLADHHELLREHGKQLRDDLMTERSTCTACSEDGRSSSVEDLLSSTRTTPVTASHWHQQAASAGDASDAETCPSRMTLVLGDRGIGVRGRSRERWSHSPRRRAGLLASGASASSISAASSTGSVIPISGSTAPARIGQLGAGRGAAGLQLLHQKSSSSPASLFHLGLTVNNHHPDGDDVEAPGGEDGSGSGMPAPARDQPYDDAEDQDHDDDESPNQADEVASSSPPTGSPEVDELATRLAEATCTQFLCSPSQKRLQASYPHLHLHGAGTGAGLVRRSGSFGSLGGESGSGLDSGDRPLSPIREEILPEGTEDQRASKRARHPGGDTAEENHIPVVRPAPVVLPAGSSS